jgi:hypothetical protein
MSTSNIDFKVGNTPTGEAWIKCQHCCPCPTHLNSSGSWNITFTVGRNHSGEIWMRCEFSAPDPADSKTAFATVHPGELSFLACFLNN